MTKQNDKLLANEINEKASVLQQQETNLARRSQKLSSRHTVPEISS